MISISNHRRILLITTFVLFSVISLYPHNLPASEEVYTIQLGAYSFSKLDLAEKLFHRMVKVLDDKELDGLRIVKARSHYLVRIGKFPVEKDSKALLGIVKGIIRDAFVLRETKDNRFTLVKSYSPGKMPEQKKTPPLTEKVIDSNKDKDTQPRTTTNNREQNPEMFYTVQIGNFLKLSDAKKDFEALKGALSSSDRRYLRVERIGRYYSVRVGLFKTYAEARSFLKKNEALLSGVIMQSYLKREDIVLMVEDENRIKTTKDTSSKKTSSDSEIRDDEENKRALDSLIESADNYLNTAEYGKAAEILRKGISQWPDNPDLYALYGETLLYLGYPEKALQEYRKATKLSPDVPDFHAGVGYSLLNIYLDRARASIEAFKKALEIDPDNINALEGLGIVYASIDRKDLATDIYQRLKELDPDAAERLNNVIQNGIDWGEQ